MDGDTRREVGDDRRKENDGENERAWAATWPLRAVFAGMGGGRGYCRLSTELQVKHCHWRTGRQAPQAMEWADNRDGMNRQVGWGRW